MPGDRLRHLRALPARTGRSGAVGCRTPGCPLPDPGALGFCASCEAVYPAARALRERLLERRGARLQAAHPGLFAALAPALRRRLVGHLAARAALAELPVEAIALGGLRDFVYELLERRLDPELER